MRPIIGSRATAAQRRSEEKGAFSLWDGSTRQDDNSREIVCYTSRAMARIKPEELRGPERIFVAGSLRVARRVEEWLTMAGVDYAVQVEPFGRTVLFRTVRNGAAFYVTSSQAKYCREQLAITGLKDGVVDDQQ
jgi:hypothetical protein